MRVVAEFFWRFREWSKAVRAAEMHAEIRRMFAGHPYNGERLRKLLAESDENPRFVSPRIKRHSAREDDTRPRIVGLIQLAALAGTLLVPMVASAGIMTIDFPTDVVPSNIVGHGNGAADGFRISPSAEYTLVAPGSWFGATDHGIGWDSDGPSNPFYLGPTKISTASLFIDHGGMPFSLVSATFVAQGGDNNFKMISSKGGSLDIPADLLGTFAASFASGQPQWTDITWLTFGYFDAGEPTAGIDQLVLAIDEPGTLAAFAIGLVILYYAERRRVVVRPRTPRQASTTRTLPL